MNKILSLFLVLLTVGFCNFVYAEGVDSFGAKPITLAKGSFLRATMQRELSTATNRAGDEVRMITTSPTFAADGLVVPENSIYYGKIIELNQPIEGCNGSMRVRIDKLVFPSGDEMTIDAMVWSKNKDYLLGGELTQPAYYSKIPHFTFGWKGGCLAFQNSGIYQVGLPTIIRAGAEMLIILEKETDFYPYEL